MITRRRFLHIITGAAGAVVLFNKLGFPARALAAIPGGTLDPTTLDKYRAPLVIPPAMPRTTKIKVKGDKNIDYYEIAVRQFQQQILPPGQPTTTVWSFGSIHHPGSFHYPAYTIEAKYRAPVRVKWINELKDAQGNYLPHILPVDPTLDWANPAGGAEGRDHHPTFLTTPGAYTGPVPFVTHLHGAHSGPESDGYPEAWYLPADANIPTGFAREGTWYEAFKAEALEKHGIEWEKGSATFQYPNDQRAGTLWYHDHTLGMTRVNVYAGPAGFYVLRGGPSDEVGGILPGPAPALGDAPGTKYYEIPVLIQDRVFHADGSLFYPDTREFFDEFAGPYIPESDIAPIWNPEFFGNTMVVNGRTWPYLEVEQRRYRLRFLNGCNSRFLILAFNDPALIFWQIGSDGGFLPAPVELSRLLVAPAERMDVIVDFSRVPAGTNIVLKNLAPDEPFGGGEPGVDFEPADPATTGQVMQFRVVPMVGMDNSTPPALLTLPAATPLGAPAKTRQVSLNEVDSEVLDDVGPRQALLGTQSSAGPQPLMWAAAITEKPVLGETEIWEIHNHTEDAHPIHVHQVQFQIVNRQPFEGDGYPPEPNETGFKDTVVSYPGEITRIKAKFDVAGLYVWHCHIIEHEDHEMMRPFRVEAPMTVG